MKAHGSLRARLLLGAAFWMSVAFIGTGFILSHLFRHHVLAQYDLELENVADQVIAAVRIEPDGPKLATEPSDPRFHRPYGSRYWQVTTDGHTLRSRSLWDDILPTAPVAPTGELRIRQLDTPSLGPVRIVERSVAFAARPDRPVQVQVAMPLAEIDLTAAGFNRLLAMALSALALLLLMAAVVQVTLGLRPLARLSREVARVRAGQMNRLPSSQPAEVAPLTEEINALLDDNEEMVSRARSQAADLAHGLKTSLQLVELEARRLDSLVATEAASGIATEVRRMRGHIDQQLARARARGQQHGRAELTDVATCVDGVLRTIRAVAGHEVPATESEVQAGLQFAGSRGDLEEILGNLLDNAAKWATKRVRITASIVGERLIFWVDDDGPGLAPNLHGRAFLRGFRLNEQVPGSGLGLTITRDLVDLYGGRITLEASPLAGLRVHLELPGRLV